MKPLRILDEVADRDLPGIVAYHLPQYRAKTEARKTKQLTADLHLSPLMQS